MVGSINRVLQKTERGCGWNPVTLCIIESVYNISGRHGCYYLWSLCLYISTLFVYINNTVQLCQ